MDKGVGKGKKALQPAVYNRINHWLRKFNRESLLFWGKIGTIMDTNERLRRLLEERGWSEYRLAKSCGLNQSTIANIYRRNIVPSIATLESICQGFGITLSQFFSEGEMVELTPEVKELFESWVALAPNQKSAVLQVVKAMNSENEIKK